tara:strand:+ start:122857 stop:124161 length:1305 start_codon:yes stop_codon:yes gene_type:complete
MRKYLLFTIFFAQVIISAGQIKTRNIRGLKLDTLSEHALALPMSFDNRFFTNEPDLPQALITKVVLVYTQHKLSPGFNQALLNKNRWEELFEKYPQLVTSNNIWQKEEWQQTEKNREAAKKLFHGFIVYYLPSQSQAERRAEVEWVMKKLNVKDDIVSNNNSAAFSSDYNTSSYYGNIKRDTARKFTLKQRWDDRVGFVHDTIWEEPEKSVDKPNNVLNKVKYIPKIDSTVWLSLEKLDSDKNYVVVMDATGSMGSYVVQGLEWIFAHRNKLKIEGVVFFNDGDNKKSKKKKAMKTGGIYFSANDSSKIVETVTKCMKNGSGGGESKENDIEAITLALNKFPQASEVILIADNKEWMRDFDYLTKIDKPVNVILCDTKVLPPNAEYFTLASFTQGKLYTNDKEFSRLTEMKNNDYFIYKGVVYRKFDNIFSREP